MNFKRLSVLTLAAAMALGFSFSNNVFAQPGPDGARPEMRQPAGNHPDMNRMHNGQPGRPDLGRPDGPDHRPGFNNHLQKRPDNPNGRPGIGRPDGRPGDHNGKPGMGRPGAHNDKGGFGRPDGRPGFKDQAFKSRPGQHANFDRPGFGSHRGPGKHFSGAPRGQHF